MADRIIMLSSGWAGPSIARGSVLALWLLSTVRLAPAGAPGVPPYMYEPRAHFVSVDRTFAGPGNAPAPGAGVYAFRDPEAEAEGTERFEIRWYAQPPGIPPGVVMLLESIPERSPVVKNHVLRFNERSEGHIRSVIEIPADEVRQTGRILKWRVRVIWRGRLLASQASDNWDG
jgi:hypothetical protein